MATEPSLPDKVVRLHEALTAAEVPHAFGGALALAYYAEPRTTQDIDLNVFVEPGRYTEVVADLRPLGISRLSTPAKVLRDGQTRIWWGRTPLDLFFSYGPVHEAMRRGARRVPFGPDTIPILGPEHLIVAKVVFDRAKDWIDIEQMLVAVEDLDLAEIDRWLDELLGAADRRAVRARRLHRSLLGPR